VLAHQHAEHVLARVALGPRDQRLHVRPARAAQLHPLVHRDRHVQLPGRALLEISPVGVGHPEQFADHQRRDRQRERRHQVGRAAPRGHRVEVLVDDLHDARLQPLHPPHGELRPEQAAQPGVLRRVQRQQLTRARLLPLLLAARIGRRAERHAVAEPVGVAEHLAHVGVAGGDPHVRPERRLEPPDAVPLAELAQLVDRRETVAPHVQRHGRCLGHLRPPPNRKRPGYDATREY
jgi:hypothetical protein